MFIKNQIIRKHIIFLQILSLLFVINCGKEESDIVFQLQSEDMQRDCSSIKTEISDIEEKLIPKEEAKKGGKLLKNIGLVILTISTAFIALLFIDSDEEQQENIKNLEKRRDYLQDLAVIKSCNAKTN
jgi:hypothetical protein